MHAQEFLTEVKIQQIEKFKELLGDREVNLIYSLRGDKYFVDLRLDDVPILEFNIENQEESDCLILFLDTIFNVCDFDYVEPMRSGG